MIIIRAVFFLFYTLSMLSLEWASAVIGWRSMHRRWAPAYKLLVALACVTAVVDTCCNACFFMHINYEGVYSVWAFVETGTILCIQFLGVRRTWAKHLFIALLVILSVGSAICCMVGWPALATMNLPLLLFTLFVQLIGACVAMIEMLQDAARKPLSAMPAFWLNTGMLFYCSVFILGHVMNIYSTYEASKYYPYFSMVANTCMYGGFIACFKTLRREDRLIFKKLV